MENPECSGFFEQLYLTMPMRLSSHCVLMYVICASSYDFSEPFSPFLFSLYVYLINLHFPKSSPRTSLYPPFLVPPPVSSEFIHSIFTAQQASTEVYFPSRKNALIKSKRNKLHRTRNDPWQFISSFFRVHIERKIAMNSTRESESSQVEKIFVFLHKPDSKKHRSSEKTSRPWTKTKLDMNTERRRKRCMRKRHGPMKQCTIVIFNKACLLIVSLPSIPSPLSLSSFSFFSINL